MARVPAAFLILLTASACLREAPAPDEIAMIRSGLVQQDGSTLPLFADDFNRTGALGNEWEVVGTASANGSAATLTSALTIAAWTGASPENTFVSASFSAPTVRTSLGVFSRASEIDPDRSHYAAYVSSGGLITLARRQQWAYTVLVEQPGSFSTSGTHKLTLIASGASPVQLAVAVDGVVVLRHSDASGSALHGAGRAGILDLNGSSLPLDKFEVSLGMRFSDDFNRSGAIGSDWVNADGSFTCNGTAAVSASETSYSAWVGTAADPVVKFTLTTPIASTYVGAFTRGSSTNPDRDHYAAFVDPSGVIKLRRRNNYTYSSLATGPSFPSGTHEIGVSTSGTNPVQITVTLDGEKVIEYSDASSSRHSTGMKVGIFDFNGAGEPIDNFTVVQGHVSSDNFGTGTTLGSGWNIATGSFAVASSRAHSTAAQSYAFIGPDALDATAAVELDYSWLMQVFSGVVLRDANAGDTHYAGGIDPNGNVRISRRNGGTYTHLATGASFPTGVHVLSLTSTGTNPVQLSLRIDGAEWLHFDDTSSSRIVNAGRAGIFSNEATYNSGQYFGRFDLSVDLIPTFFEPPILAEIPETTFKVGQLGFLFMSATDRNGGALTFSFNQTELPADVKISSLSVPFSLGGATRTKNVGVLRWTPLSTQSGEWTPTITVTDSTGRTDSQQVTINVEPSCSPIVHFLNVASPAPTPNKIYYVDDVSTNGSGSSTSPFNSISDALDQVKYFCKYEDGGTIQEEECQQGVRVHIRKGNYEEKIYEVDLRGTPSAPIWIGGELGEEPTLADYRGSGSTNEVIQLVKPRYVVLEHMTIGRPDNSFTKSHGLNIEDGGLHNDVEAAQHVIVRNVHFKNIGTGSTVQNCIKPSGLNNFAILDNTFENCGQGSGGGNGVNADGCHDGVIAGNNFFGRTFVMAKGGSRNIEIRKNTYTQQLLPGNDALLSHRLGGAMNTDGFRPSLETGTGDSEGFFYEARHIRLISNIIKGGTEIRFEGCYQCLVANNTVIDPTDRLFFITQAQLSRSAILNKGDYGKLVSEGRVYNNIFYFSDSSLEKAELDSFVDGREDTWGTFEFRGNLYCNGSNPSTCEPAAGGIEASSVPESPTVSDELEGVACPGGAPCDPQFTDAEQYLLETGSPALNTGVSLIAGSPSVMEDSGYVPPSGAWGVEDRMGVCFAASPSNPSRGAREVP